MTQETAPKVVIVILNWNQLDDTSECLKSLRTLDYLNYHTIVVDNGSEDGSDEGIAREFPEVTLIRNENNLGFVGGNNVGIERALDSGGDYIFVLNNDTVVDPRVLSELVDVAEADPSIAIAGPQMFYHDEPDELWFLRASLKWPLAEMTLWNQREKRPFEEGVVFDTDFIAGAGMLIRSSAIRELGAFDPFFFIYWEDVELCVRYARAGHELKTVSSAKLWHKVSRSATAGRTAQYLMARNQLYLCRKYGGFWQFWFRVVPTNLVRLLGRLVTSRFRGSSVAGLRGTIAYFRGWRGARGLEGVS